MKKYLWTTTGAGIIRCVGWVRRYSAVSRCAAECRQKMQKRGQGGCWTLVFSSSVLRPTDERTHHSARNPLVVESLTRYYLERERVRSQQIGEQGRHCFAVRRIYYLVHFRYVVNPDYPAYSLPTVIKKRIRCNREMEMVLVNKAAQKGNKIEMNEEKKDNPRNRYLL